MKQKKTKKERQKNKQENVHLPQKQHPAVDPDERNLQIDNKYNFLFIITILIAGIIAYSNSFDCSFHFDDSNVFQSSVTTGLASIGDWLRLFPNRPIGMLTFALNYNIHGLNLWGYHLVNLIIHLTNAFLVWWLTWLTLSTPVMKETQISRHKAMAAFLTGLLFVTHPLATQAVTYIAQRFASLATLFYLLSLILFVQGKLWQGGRKIPWFLFGGSIVCAVMGMLTKEIVFTLPFAIILYDYCFLKTAPWKFEMKDTSLIISFTMLVIFILVFFKVSSVSPFSLFSPVAPDQGYTYSISMKEYFLTQFRVILTYIRLFILPFNQNLDYDYPLSTGFFQLKTFLSFSLLLGILATGVLLFKRYRLISFGIFWFFLTMSVESSIIPISQNVIFEHRTYLPGVGFFLAMTGAFFYFFKERYLKIAVIILLMIASINAVLTYQRNKIWLNDYTLWSDGLKKSLDKARVHVAFGLALFNEGKIDEAIDHYKQAIRITPDYSLPFNNRGNAFLKSGQYQHAIEDYNEAIRLKPDYAEAYNNRGTSYDNLGQYQRAIEDYNEVIRLKPDFAPAYINRGLAYANLGQYQQAIEDCKEAIRLNPNYAEAYYNWGFASLKLGQYQQAIENFNKAISLKQDYAKAYNNRGVAYLSQGNNELGCPDAQKACALGNCKALEWAKGKGFCH
jgi:protein O-mannosyl-transferase